MPNCSSICSAIHPRKSDKRNLDHPSSVLSFDLPTTVVLRISLPHYQIMSAIEVNSKKKKISETDRRDGPFGKKRRCTDVIFLVSLLIEPSYMNESIIYYKFSVELHLIKSLC